MSSRSSGKPILAQAADTSGGAIADNVISPLAHDQSLLWMYCTFLLLLLLGGGGVLNRLQLKKKQKELRFAQYKNEDLKKKLKLALVTIRRMEANPDLVHARGFNLDYLRMRMDEEVFHYVIINQIKMRVNHFLGANLRPGTENVPVGIVTGGRQVDETFDVTYEVETPDGQRKKGVLFRIQVKLTKLPVQLSSNIVSQVIDCIERFLAPINDRENWQPSIQGNLVLISWDQKAKPTPLLVIEQSGEGNSANFRTNPAHAASNLLSSLDSGELGKH